MPKIFLMLGILAFVGYWLTRPEPEPAALTALTNSCLNAKTGDEKQCRCLATGLHQRLSDKELAQFLNGEALEASFVQYVEQLVADISRQCR